MSDGLSTTMASSTPQAATTPLAKPTQLTHDPYRQATLLQQALSPDKMRIAFLLGAGCPVAIEVPNGNTTKPLIPDIKGLTSHVSCAIQASPAVKRSFGVILKRLAADGRNNPTIEEILTHIRTLFEVVGSGNVDGLSKECLALLDREICKVTTEVMRVPLPAAKTPYHYLATWIGGIRRIHPVEIFTPNYDLLVEQALEAQRIPYFDGFVGAHHAFFDIVSMEQDTLPARWVRLWKVHGSINWWRTTSEAVERRETGDPTDRQMIYPSHLKYEQSRRMPYLAMLDRLRGFLTQGQAVLVTCGYSFADKHLNDVILQGLGANPNAICFGLLFGDLAKHPEAAARAHEQPNFNAIAADAAVLGTIERSWAPTEKIEHPLHGLAVGDDGKGQHSGCRYLLGDFGLLGNFLGQQLAYRQECEGNGHAA